MVRERQDGPGPGRAVVKPGIIPQPHRKSPVRGASRRHADPPFKMALDTQDVQRIAHLARLELSAAEQDTMLGQLNGFFGIVEAMSREATGDVQPLYTPLSAVQTVTLRLREDAVTEADERARNQRSAPAVQDGLFLVPKVIE